VQGWKKRSGFDFERAFSDLLDSASDAEPMIGIQRQRSQD
jgi:hypothetical protein